MINFVKNIPRETWGIHLLRLGIAGIFLWFGFSQIFDGIKWVSMVPDWAVNFIHLPPAMIVLANGTFEIILASLLAMGFFVRIISIILALHLLPIALSFGFEATGIRDAGIVVAAFALGLLYRAEKSL
jgi:uncharacterized membrane protein YphA (DoxX/SURF4 family)